MRCKRTTPDDHNKTVVRRYHWRILLDRIWMASQRAHLDLNHTARNSPTVAFLERKGHSTRKSIITLAETAERGFHPRSSHNPACCIPSTSMFTGSPSTTFSTAFLSTFPFFCPSRSPRMRSSSTLAGSSFGSCGTSRPANASLRMLWRRRSARLRLASTMASSSLTMEPRRR